MRRMMRVLVAVGAVAALALAGAAVIVAPAVAAPSAGSVCSPGQPYPPSAGVMLRVSTDTPYQGQSIEVSGSGYCANETVTLMMSAQRLGTAHASAKGSFEVKERITENPGRYRLTGTGQDGDHASVAMTVRPGSGVEPISAHRPGANAPGANGHAPAANGAVPAAGGPGAGGLAFTGVDVALLIAIAVVPLGAGSYLVYAGRRRRLTRG
jgi:hypothetical protein